MARWGLTVMVCVATVALAAVGGASAASENEPPMAEAGLDQTVDNGTTVYLDAGGSVDPDGTLTSVQWEITDPDGDAVTPGCATCTRTEFTPNETGQYTANLTVTDDDGATRTDTLYVTVETPDGPHVSLMGPDRTTQGEPTEFTVSTDAGDAELRRLHWRENGSNEREFDLSGDESNVTLNRSFSETRSYELEATVQDAKGYTRTSSLQVHVVSGGGGGGAGADFEHCEDGGSPYFADGDFIGCNDGGADMIYGDHVLEANGESGISLNNDAGHLVEMASESQVEQMKDSSDDVLTREEVSQNHETQIENKYDEVKSDALDGIPKSSQESSDGVETSSGDEGEEESPPVETPPKVERLMGAVRIQGGVVLLPVADDLTT